MTTSPRGARLAALLAGTAVAVPLLLAGPAGATQPEAGDGGQLVLVGGSLADDNAEVYGEIVERAGGADARIGIITAAAVPASQDPDAGTEDGNNSVDNGTYYADLLEGFGAGETTWIPLDLDHPEVAHDPAVVEQVGELTGFFFGGGDQYRYVTLMTEGPEQEDTPLLAAVRDRFEDGAVVAGTSAGMQIMAGANMVTGGESWEALAAGSAPGYFDDPTELGYLPRGGFGFFASGLLDTHFGAWGRQGRAIRLASDTGEERVFGVDPNTALVVDHAGTDHEQLSVLGENGVNLLDLRDARPRTSRGEWSIRGVRWSWLTDGDRYDAARRDVTPSAAARELRPTVRGTDARRTDVFSSLAGDGTEFVLSDLARALASSKDRRTTGTTFETDPRFQVGLVEGPGFRAYTTDGSQASSYESLRVSVRATR
ncbi:cyanophycinase [Isoptericola sp. S6320L]|uniref:cyanophycinase n=1 Tax=Isoptericola sp. S6320L TaxID=2926411 RepID=UPI001FF4AF36|nr:cyanophycinase [Isoptericola sp. S6320L]MCK0117411.1 cyanophycinase [Isoptericola sp. S6320L]